ncbi:hypothetical protein JCM8547_001189 [Rhodosporidiobolus lusitaniae]
MLSHLLTFLVFFSSLTLSTTSPSPPSAQKNQPDLLARRSPSTTSSSSWSNAMKRALHGSELLKRRFDPSPGGLGTREEKRAPGQQHDGLKKKKKKRMEVKVRQKRKCYYVGTFFHLIDCNAGVNTTQIPYASVQPTQAPPTTTATPVAASSASPASASASGK